MKIVALTDSHGNLKESPGLADALAAADVVLLAGDITHFGHARDAAAMVEGIRRHCATVFAVPGNCDPPDVAEWLVKERLGIDGRCLEHEGVTFLGLGGSLPCPGPTPNERPDTQFESLIAKATKGLGADAKLVLLSHQPPAQTANDRIHSGAHVGSAAIRRFIERRQPLVCFTGHIHEAAGTDRIGETHIVNPGPARKGGYAYAEIAEELSTIEIRRFD